VSAARLVAVAALGGGCLSKPSFECEVAPGVTELRGQLGTQGGNGEDPVLCGTRAVVGLGFTMTRQGIVNGQKIAITAFLRCAPLSNHGGDYELGKPEDVEVPGGSVTEIEGPFFADCPPGQGVVGLAGHIVDTDSFFNSVTIFCAAFDLAGAPSGDVTRIPLLETGTDRAESEAQCNGDEALSGLKSYRGDKLDRLQLACAHTECR